MILDNLDLLIQRLDAIFPDFIINDGLRPSQKVGISEQEGTAYSPPKSIDIVPDFESSSIARDNTRAGNYLAQIAYSVCITLNNAVEDLEDTLTRIFDIESPDWHTGDFEFTSSNDGNYIVQITFAIARQPYYAKRF